VPVGEAENSIVAALDRLPLRLRDLGFEISTGPVVSFRATQFLRDQRAKDTAPLLWLHNVRPFVTRFPPKNDKPCHIEVSGQSRRILVPAKRYVLLKRFTSKEERKRVVAGIVESTDSYSEWLGLENHLNYIHRRANEMTRLEALGLAAYLNSRVVDRYFRAISGNTQVNATEIRALPFPDNDTLVEIGRTIIDIPRANEEEIDRHVMSALMLPDDLAECAT
jgi:adenine-specific DNA-methyltransferase